MPHWLPLDSHCSRAVLDNLAISGQYQHLSRVYLDGMASGGGWEMEGRFLGELADAMLLAAELNAGDYEQQGWHEQFADIAGDMAVSGCQSVSYSQTRAQVTG